MAMGDKLELPMLEEIDSTSKPTHLENCVGFLLSLLFIHL